MEHTPILDRKYLKRIGFVLDEGLYSKKLEAIGVHVDHETGEGVLVTRSLETPVKFITVSHLKWFMDVFK